MFSGTGASADNNNHALDNNFHWNLNPNAHICFHEYTSEHVKNVTCEVLANFSGLKVI